MLHRKALFLWIPKTAGMSVSEACRTHASCSGIFTSRLIRTPLNRERDFITFGHRSIQTLLDDNRITRKQLSQRFIFTVVRNPWDRFVSLFAWWCRHPTLRVNALNAKTGRPDFAYCLHKIADGADPLGIYSHQGTSQANPQVRWLEDEHTGSWWPDFVARFETLDEDWEVLRRILGCGPLPHKNRTRHVNYRRYYTSELRQCAANLFSEDIEIFKYTF